MSFRPSLLCSISSQTHTLSLPLSPPPLSVMLLLLLLCTTHISVSGCRTGPGCCSSFSWLHTGTHSTHTHSHQLFFINRVQKKQHPVATPAAPAAVPANAVDVSCRLRLRHSRISNSWLRCERHIFERWRNCSVGIFADGVRKRCLVKIGS